MTRYVVAAVLEADGQVAEMDAIVVDAESEPQALELARDSVEPDLTEDDVRGASWHVIRLDEMRPA